MSRALLESTLEAVQDGVLVADLDGNIIAYNRPFLALWGIPQDVARGADDEELLSYAADRLDDPGTFLSKVRELYEEAERASTDLVWFDDGRVVKRWTYPFGVGGEPTGRVWTFRDVTDEVESRQAASQATRKLQQIVEAAPVAIITVDRGGRITTWNPAAERILGHEAKEVLGTTFASLEVDDEEAGGLTEPIAAALDGHRQQALPLTYHPPQGDVRILELSYGPVEENGEILGVVVIASDRTEEHRAHEALAKLEHRHAAWLEVAPDVTVTLDDDGCITALNPAFEEITGWDREVWLGRAFIDLVHPDDTDALLEGYQAALDGQQPLATTFRYEASDGSWRWASALGRPVIEDDEIVDFFAIVRDVTEQRRRQEDAHRSLRRQVEIERLEEQARERQELVATTAHELSKPLTPMRFQLATLRMVLEADVGTTDPGVEEVIEGLERSLSRLERLVDDLSKASEAEREVFVIEPEVLSLDEIVVPVARSYRPAADEKGLRLEIERTSQVPIEGDAQRLEQVVANLVENAIKFTEPDGSILVTIDQAEAYARLVVTDTGQGLTKAQMTGLFQPFSQVHEGDGRGSGSGLGLYVTKAIVEAHGGRIWCDSAGPDQGATFHVQLPLASETGDEPEVN